MTGRGFLVLSISALSDALGEVHYRTLSVASALGDPGFERASKVAARFGYALKSDGHRRSRQDREEWPLTIRVYTSFRRDGRGRSGSSLWTYPAKRLACGRCQGRGRARGTETPCKTCSGSGMRGTRA